MTAAGSTSQVRQPSLCLGAGAEWCSLWLAGGVVRGQAVLRPPSPARAAGPATRVPCYAGASYSGCPLVCPHIVRSPSDQLTVRHVRDQAAEEDIVLCSVFVVIKNSGPALSGPTCWTAKLVAAGSIRVARKCRTFDTSVGLSGGTGDRSPDRMPSGSLGFRVEGWRTHKPVICATNLTTLTIIHTLSLDQNRCLI